MSIEQLLRPMRTLYPPQKRSLSEVSERLSELGLFGVGKPPAYEGHPEYDYVDMVKWSRSGAEHGVLRIYRVVSGRRSIDSGILVHMLLSEEDDASASLHIVDLANRMYRVGSEDVLSRYIGEDCDWGDYISLKTASQELCIYINSRRFEMIHTRNQALASATLAEEPDIAQDAIRLGCESRVIRQISVDGRADDE
jgi:hypothetical protein